MYYHLQGRVIEKTATSLVLETGGVGYLMQISLSTSEGLPPVGQTVKILTHFVVREDAQMLFGFLTEEERQLFKYLISVSGIGPKTAMTVLSGLSVSELKRAIVEGEVPVLTHIPGIGRKTAERLIVELREKIVVEGHRKSEAGSLAGGVSQNLLEDSLDALVALGYRRQSAKEALEKVMRAKSGEPWTIENLIRASLKHV